METVTATKAMIEFDILEKSTPDAIVLEFKDEILNLVEKFGQSGQSGGSAPFTSRAISSVVEDLCMHNPIGGITCDDNEFDKCGESDMHQNKRLTSVFKHGVNGKPYYLNAIVFTGQSGVSFTTSGDSVCLKDGTSIHSTNYIKDLPFKQKTFYIDVIETEWADKDELVEKSGGGWWTSIVKDERQLDEVWKYYIRKND